MFTDDTAIKNRRKIDYTQSLMRKTVRRIDHTLASRPPLASARVQFAEEVMAFVRNTDVSLREINWHLNVWFGMIVTEGQVRCLFPYPDAHVTVAELGHAVKRSVLSAGSDICGIINMEAGV